MTKTPSIILLFYSILAFTVCPAQSKHLSGIVRDSHSDETIPFASVSFKGTTVGILTDTAGKFSFRLSSWPADSLEITCVGYQPLTTAINQFKDTVTITLRLERGTFLEGARVSVRVNKGLLLWRKIVAHKAENDRYRFDNFSYELHNRLELDLKNVNFEKLSRFKPLKSVSELILENIDTSEGLKYLPAYLAEVISDYYYQNRPVKRREIIKASNTAKIKNESFTRLLGGMDQNVNIYNNFIPVFDKKFISPLHSNADNYYGYRVVDTQFFNKRKFYHLVFVPKRKGENTFEGDCWVHDSTFAIQKMNLRLGKEVNINFLKTLSLIQEYSLINDTTWFLAKDKFVADVSPMGKKMPGFIGRKTTTYRHIVVNDSSVIRELDKNNLMEEVITLPESAAKSGTYWDTARHEELSYTEKGIFRMIDTLVNAPVFRKFTRAMNFISMGYLDIGKFQIGPWYNWATYNGWERMRFRFDLGTNTKFNKKLKLSAYLAYGTGDEQLKGKAEIFYLPKKRPRVYLFASYVNDLDFGQSYYGEISTDNIFALAARKTDVPVKFLNTKEKRFEFFRYSRSGFSTLVSVIHKQYNPLKNLPPGDSFTVKGYGTPLTTFNVSLKLRFAFLEKFLENNFYRTSLGSPYPIPEVYFSKGFSGIFNSPYRYTKISASISDMIKIPPYGNLTYSVYAGKTYGTLPFVLLDIHPGNELHYYNRYAFNTMNKYDFVSDKYAGINVEHIFGNGIFRLFGPARKLKFRQFWNIKTLWGSLSPANKTLNFKQGYTFHTLNGKTFMELGTGLDNILKIFRLDFVWRVLPVPLPEKRSEKFGVFGSVRFSF